MDEQMVSHNSGKTRRNFIKETSLIASAFTIVPSYVLGGPGKKAPSDKLNIAGIGIGGMGKNNIKHCADENIVALCDVDDAYAGPVFAEYPREPRHHRLSQGKNSSPPPLVWQPADRYVIKSCF